MRIKHLVIENFRAIEHLELNCADGMNVFIGDNGTGKSTVLEAVAILYSWLPALVKSTKGKGRLVAEQDIKRGAAYCYLEIGVEYKGSWVEWSLMKGEERSEKRTRLNELRGFAEHLRYSVEDNKPLMTLYGINRNITTISVDKNLYDAKEKKAKRDKNATAIFSWRSFFNWYYERENEENRMKARFNPKYHDETLDAVRHCMEEVFPGYTNLRIEDRPKTHFVVDKQGMAIDFSMLSDGEKSYITLVLDIARRLAERNEDPTSIFRCEHVILIDEVDLHLHPSWQLFVINNLRRMFPRCQFFITSHSPLVLSSLEQQGQLVVLKNGRRFEVSDIPYGDNGDYILKRFFGLNEVRNPKVQREIDILAAELGKQKPNLEQVEQTLDKLSREGVNFDEAAKMRLVLAQKKKEL
mgnify:CR=1 FL=1